MQMRRYTRRSEAVKLAIERYFASEHDLGPALDINLSGVGGGGFSRLSMVRGTQTSVFDYVAVLRLQMYTWERRWLLCS